jgi:nascent polypeptide-associated complex subunit alpha
MNLNSKQMRQMMKKMGMEQEPIEAEQVIIRMKDQDLVFNDPEVAQVNLMGQETFQITGDFEVQLREKTPDIEEDDIDTVVEQTGVSREDAKKAIVESEGDLAEAIMKLQAND